MKVSVEKLASQSSSTSFALPLLVQLGQQDKLLQLALTL